MEPRIDTGESGTGSCPASVRPSAPYRFCLFTLGEESFAVDLSQVSEVFRLELITPMPGMPSMLVGVANLRGTIVPLADLRPLLGVPGSLAPRYAVIVRHGTQQIGIVVDAVPEIGTIEADDMDDLLEGLPDEMARHRPFLSGLLRISGRVRGLVEASRLMAVVEGTLDQQAA